MCCSLWLVVGCLLLVAVGCCLRFIVLVVVGVDVVCCGLLFVVC